LKASPNPSEGGAYEEVSERNILIILKISKASPSGRFGGAL
jgi:hypothetical protein